MAAHIGTTDYRTEPGAEGLPQLVIPGAEAAPVAQVLQRRMDAPKAPSKPQRAADHGLFDAGARAQLPLF